MRVLLLSFACLACSAPPRPRVATMEETAHFFDRSGAPIHTYESAWPILRELFGTALPTRIVVEHRMEGTSRFDPEHQAIVISQQSTKTHSELSIVAHETAHLGLARLTNGASATEPFRFLDEGLAMIVEKRVEGTFPQYRSKALARAAGRLVTSSVRLVDLQRWSSYFGEPPHADFSAYDVGAAFLFFIADAYGTEKPKALLTDIGRTRSMTASFMNVLGTSLDETEVAWESYLRGVAVHVPSIVETFPPNGASGVATDLHEVRVKFDTDMAPQVCIKTDCHDGLCYDHARWTNARTLTIEIDGALLSSHAYSLSLGVPGRCRLESASGVEAPVIAWTFSTR